MSGHLPPTTHVKSTSCYMTLGRCPRGNQGALPRGSGVGPDPEIGSLGLLACTSTPSRSRKHWHLGRFCVFLTVFVSQSGSSSSVFNPQMQALVWADVETEAPRVLAACPRPRGLVATGWGSARRPDSRGLDHRSRGACPGGASVRIPALTRVPSHRKSIHGNSARSRMPAKPSRTYGTLRKGSVCPAPKPQQVKKIFEALKRGLK